MSQTPLFFIVGVPRSGTTLLSVLLNGHSQVFIDKEAIAIRTLDFKQRVEDTIGQPGNEFKRWRRAAEEDERLLRFLNWQDLDNGTPDSLGEFVAKSFSQRARSNNKELFGDKSPDAIARLPELLSLFPRAKLIHVVRDARPNVASLVKRQYLHPQTAAQLWKDWNKMGLSARQWLGEDRVLKVRYEDLLTDAAGELSRVCNLLGIAFEDNMLKLEAARATQAKDAYVKKSIDVAALDRWQTEMTDEEIATIERLTASLMPHLGYEPVTTDRQDHNLSYLASRWYKIVNKARLVFVPVRKHMKDRRLVDVRVPLRKRLFDLGGTIIASIISKDLLQGLWDRNR